MNKRKAVRIHLISLGCPKNLVDSEVILGDLASRGMAITSDIEDADVVLVNTCGFIESAREESIQALLEVCELKKSCGGRLRVVAAGCLGQRFGEELRREIPEIDAIVGLSEYGGLGDLVEKLARDRPGSPTVLRVSDPTTACQSEVGRFRLTPRHYAYLKISEGCDNPCTFCAIPAIRGRFRSKPLDAIASEARELAASGVRELVLISQDTTAYGLDLDSGPRLPDVLEAVAAAEGIAWVRLLYTYPAHMTDETIEAVASIPEVVKYIDLPLQHIAPRLLRRMGRRFDAVRTRKLLDRMRERISGLYLRTTFIVGFPGETDDDFAELRRFVEEFQFERLGVFAYSPEEGTAAASFADPVPEKVRDARLEEIMLAQQEVAFRQSRQRIGEETEILVDSLAPEAPPLSLPAGSPFLAALARGRSAGEAPEIDPCVYLSAGGSGIPPTRTAGPAGRRPASGAKPTPPDAGRGGVPRIRSGEFLRARIVAAHEYDLLASVAEGA